ncbi:sigma-70 family RNA polymerase sigma factor [Streptomyces sp. C10-9-1]|uniref:sigma-70 family RNA polymerase sigma factor n=1 Tax=Streptomyces sp. C10-9-1 TaxID=1859285 RepID=UPI0021118F28|nr:sigma-70 family RNA polymerase sigma factor [Streptomyces sp. C10-9-1]MCQ6554270.1 sigma-70 family RNA polymerase sigma factor [Streptomyces sp. C10-9-1]
MTVPEEDIPTPPAAVVGALGALVAAEATAEAPGAAAEAGDLEQAVWLRLLERLDGDGVLPPDAARWIRSAVRAEARRTRRTAARERPLRGDPPAAPFAEAASSAGPERAALHAERRRAVRRAVAGTPGRCPRLLSAMLAPEDLTYREIAGALGISQGSLGPMRSRCLGCLRRMLAAEVAAPGHRGRER